MIGTDLPTLKRARAREIPCDVMFDRLQELSEKALRVAKGAPGTLLHLGLDWVALTKVVSLTLEQRIVRRENFHPESD